MQDCTVEGHGVGSHRVVVTAAGNVRERLEDWDPVAYRRLEELRSVCAKAGG